MDTNPFPDVHLMGLGKKLRKLFFKLRVDQCNIEDNEVYARLRTTKSLLISPAGILTQIFRFDSYKLLSSAHRIIIRGST
jgi:hypothetical protein